MIEEQIEIETGDGRMQTYVCRPERGEFPTVLLYMDAFGIREELRSMARRIGASGYQVILPNLYYRMGEHELGPDPESGDTRWIDRLTACVQSLSIPLVLDDTRALLAFAKAQAGVRPSQVGALGYCMSGRFAVAAAAVFPDQVKAAASIYGTWLVSDDPQSPHRMGAQAPGELYFACAEVDHWAPLEVVEQLRTALVEANANAEIEIYRGVEHGFAFETRHSYDRAAADRHWERIFALFRRTIG